ncbi:S8 family serine peptidase [Actinomadura hibisca]|uniref:S8 family serine peptidase n=1 Tax=Actinomadura hibisca TaxID=68565 RepID=UPI00082A5D3F|nr:S8 family serine peptidase [Actinomadura hibisca]
MLTRRTAGLLAAALTIALAPPLSGTARADGNWIKQMLDDFDTAEKSAQGRSVKVAVLADGVAEIPSLKGRLDKEHDLVRTPRPYRKMGTLAAAMIAGEGALAPQARVLPVRVHADKEDPGGKRWLEKNHDWNALIARGIRYAADHGADVIVTSAWAGKDDQLLGSVAHAHGKNAVVVAAAGLQAPTDLRYPVAQTGVIGVGATDAFGRRDKKYTKASSTVLVSAPGIRTPSIGADGREWAYWGDAPAVSWVAAAVTLVKAKYPKLPPGQVNEVISRSARHPSGAGRYDTDIGYGYVNPAGALKEAAKLTPGPAAIPKGPVADSAHFGGGPETIRAVPYNVPWLIGFGALGVAGLVALGAAIFLAVRRRPAESSDAGRS